MEFYLMWFDDDRKKSTGNKIEEAVAAYERKFRKRPNVVLMSERERAESTPSVELRPLSYIQPSNFYVGFEDAA